MRLSCGFAPSPAVVEHARVAEDLGYERVWLYDSPALYGDVWAALALVAQGTSRIGLGTGVLVPSSRHPIVNASAIALIEQLAPGRLEVGIGSGFTARYILGQKPMKWADVEAYVLALRALLRGEETEWDGKAIKMIHPAGFAPARPIEVPILIGADGPKGTAVAERLGAGIFAGGVPNANAKGRHVVLTFGTALDEGEAPDSDRVVEAAGPAAAVAYHGIYERAGAEALAGIPGGPEWLASIEAIPADKRHLAIHEGHFVELTERDRAAFAAGGAAMVAPFTFTGTAAELQEKAAALEASGVTEIAYAPMGPDMHRELRAFAAALT